MFGSFSPLPTFQSELLYTFVALQAMREQDEREKMVDTLMTIEERKRPYNSLKADNTKQPTEDEMDAFMRKRKRADDPMNSFVGDI